MLAGIYILASMITVFIERRRENVARRLRAEYEMESLLIQPRHGRERGRHGVADAVRVSGRYKPTRHRTL